MLSRLWLSPSTNHTLLIEIEELPIVLEPMILPVWFPPNPTVPPSFMVRVRNKDLSPVMCREQPLSRYQDFCFSLPFRHTCNINNVCLRYTYLCGSSWVSPRSLELSLCLLSEVVLLCLLPDYRFRTFSLGLWLSIDSLLYLKSRLLTFRLCFLQDLFIGFWSFQNLQLWSFWFRVVHHLCLLVLRFWLSHYIWTWSFRFWTRSCVDFFRLRHMLEQGCFTSHLLSFDNNKVLKIINWIC